MVTEFAKYRLKSLSKEDYKDVFRIPKIHLARVLHKLIMKIKNIKAKYIFQILFSQTSINECFEQGTLKDSLIEELRNIIYCRVSTEKKLHLHEDVKNLFIQKIIENLSFLCDQDLFEDVQLSPELFENVDAIFEMFDTVDPGTFYSGIRVEIHSKNNQDWGEPSWFQKNKFNSFMEIYFSSWETEIMKKFSNKNFHIDNQSSKISKSIQEKVELIDKYWNGLFLTRQIEIWNNSYLVLLMREKPKTRMAERIVEFLKLFFEDLNFRFLEDFEFSEISINFKERIEKSYYIHGKELNSFSTFFFIILRETVLQEITINALNSSPSIKQKTKSAKKKKTKKIKKEKVENPEKFHNEENCITCLDCKKLSKSIFASVIKDFQLNEENDNTTKDTKSIGEIFDDLTIESDISKNSKKKKKLKKKIEIKKAANELNKIDNEMPKSKTINESMASHKEMKGLSILKSETEEISGQLIENINQKSTIETENSKTLEIDRNSTFLKFAEKPSLNDDDDDWMCVGQDEITSKKKNKPNEKKNKSNEKEKEQKRVVTPPTVPKSSPSTVIQNEKIQKESPVKELLQNPVSQAKKIEDSNKEVINSKTSSQEYTSKRPINIVNPENYGYQRGRFENFNQPARETFPKIQSNAFNNQWEFDEPKPKVKLSEKINKKNISTQTDDFFQLSSSETIKKKNNFRMVKKTDADNAIKQRNLKNKKSKYDSRDTQTSPTRLNNYLAERTSVFNQKCEKILKTYIDKDLQEFVEGINAENSRLEGYRNIIFKRIQVIVVYLFPQEGYSLHFFGSSANGLAIPSSDIDLSILGSQVFQEIEIQTVLEQLFTYLQNFEWVKSCKAIFTANVPIIKLEIDPTIKFTRTKNGQFPLLENYNLDLPSDSENQRQIVFPIDISCVQPPGYEILSRNVGFHSTNLIKQWLLIYPSLKNVILYLKTFMSIRNLNNSYNGGISSYCLILMIFCIMKEFNLQPNSKASEILLYFFKFFGEEFSYRKTGIALNMSKPFFPIEDLEQTSTPRLIIYEPITNSLSLAQNAFQIEKITSHFGNAMKMIKGFKEEIKQYLSSKIEMSANSIEKISDELQNANILQINTIEKILYSYSETI